MKTEVAPSVLPHFANCCNATEMLRASLAAARGPSAFPLSMTSALRGINSRAFSSASAMRCLPFARASRGAVLSATLQPSLQAGKLATRRGFSAAAAARPGAPRAVGYWLMGTAGMVFAMVVLGGVTRLTRSGLSIVEWRPAGERYPANDEEWAEEFEKYKLSPEYQRVNSRMSLEEFKPIYFMEWAHRMWGRAIGLAFGLPLVGFALTKTIPAGYGGRLGLLLTLGAAQGGVGWWMVKSGLQHENFNEHQMPRVSPYRLTTHLGFAWTVYSLLLWNGWDLLRKPIAAGLTQAQVAAARSVRPWAVAGTGILGVTIASGAFVAGNDAGHAYNDWPLFAGRVIPEEIWDEKLGVRNFFENTATVQFDHRMLAYSSIAAVGMLHGACRKAGWKTLPPAVRKGALVLGALVGGQALLGISTLMMYVPVSLGAAHQAGALTVWTGALYALHSISMSLRGTAAGAAVAGAAGAAASGAAAAAAKVHPAATAAAVGGMLCLADQGARRD